MRENIIGDCLVVDYNKIVLCSSARNVEILCERIERLFDYSVVDNDIITVNNEPLYLHFYERYKPILTVTDWYYVLKNEVVKKGESKFLLFGYDNDYLKEEVAFNNEVWVRYRAHLLDMDVSEFKFIVSSMLPNEYYEENKKGSRIKRAGDTSRFVREHAVREKGLLSRLFRRD